MTELSHSASKRSVVIMLLSLLFFAANVLLLRGLSIYVPQADGWVGILFRGAIGLGLLLAIFSRGGSLDLAAVIRHPKLVARGLVGAFATLLFYITIVKLGASRAIVINLSYPLFGVIIAAIWLKEPLTVRAGSWILAGFAGLLLFFSQGAFQHGLSGYDFVALLSAVTSGIAVVLIRGLSKDHHPSTIYASQCVYGLILTAPIAGHALLSLPAVAWILLTLGAVLAAVGQMAITIAFRHLSVAKGSSIQMLLPLLTAAGAYALFDERLSPSEIAGGCLTLLATWQVLRSPAPVQSAPASETSPLPAPPPAAGPAIVNTK